MGRAGRAAFIMELCSIRAWSNFGFSWKSTSKGRLNLSPAPFCYYPSYSPTFGLPSKLGFLLFMLVLRLSNWFLRRQQKQQQTFWNSREQKLCGGRDFWLELLICLSSDQATDCLRFFRQGMQKQHFVSSTSPKIIWDDLRLPTFCLLRQHNSLSQKERQQPGWGGVLFICVIVWTWN